VIASSYETRRFSSDEGEKHALSATKQIEQNALVRKLRNGTAIEKEAGFAPRKSQLPTMAEVPPFHFTDTHYLRQRSSQCGHFEARLHERQRRLVRLKKFDLDVTQIRCLLTGPGRDDHVARALARAKNVRVQGSIRCLLERASNV
jgi:hypothetical protein